MPVIVPTMPPMRSDCAPSCWIASATAAEDAATSRIAAVADSAALTPSRATARASSAACAVCAATLGAGRGAAGGLLDGLAGGFDAADLALGALRDLGHGGGDLATARPVSSDVAAICCEAAATVWRCSDSSAIVAASWARIAL